MCAALLLPAALLAAAAAADADGESLRPVSISASPKPPPVAMPSTLIELDGSVSSNPDGGELTFRWRQVSGPKVELSDYSSPKPYFRTSQPGVYEFELVVSANDLDSEPHLVRLEIERENLPPVAILGPDFRGQVGKEMEVAAPESFDPEGEPLLYRWRPLTPGFANLSPAELSSPVLSFVPMRDGVFELELVVSDGEKFSAPVVTRLTIRPRPLPPVAKVRVNTLEIPASPVQELAAMTPPLGGAVKPFARIEGPVVANAGEMVMLDARKSGGNREGRLEYLWRQKSGPFINDFELVFDGAAQRFKASRPGDYEFELVVSNGAAESEPVVHKVRIVEEIDPPVAVVVAPVRAKPGDLVKLDATQSYDISGTPLIYRWRQTGGPQVKNYVIDEKLGDSAPAFHPPASGIYSFELIVSNGKQQSSPVELDIEVGDARIAPKVIIRGPEVATAGDRLVLEGGAPDSSGRTLSYVWRQSDGPAHALGQTNGSRAVVAPPVAGRYVFEIAALEGGRVLSTAQHAVEVFSVPSSLRGNASPVTPQTGVVGALPQTPQTGTPVPTGGRRVPELAPIPTAGSTPVTPSFSQPKLPLPATSAASPRGGEAAQDGNRSAAQVMQGGSRFSVPPLAEFP